MAAERNVRRRRGSFGVVGRPSPNATSILHGTVLREVAEYLPVPQRFGTLRNVSRGFQSGLPAFPKPDPVFQVSFRITSEGTFIQLGNHTLSQMRALLEQVQSGSVLLPTRGDGSNNRLLFTYAPVGRVPFPNTYYEQQQIAPSQFDYGVSIASQAPAFRATTRYSEPRVFVHEDWEGLAARGAMISISIDAILRALWLAYASREQEHQERVQRQIMAQEVLQTLPRDVVLNELVPFLPYQRA